ncbi:MAG: metallopeptidase family protein [Chloroflexi bacterium]|nr:MAG: metallopeptidase family protein [Chloroflexota bacterium]
MTGWWRRRPTLEQRIADALSAVRAGDHERGIVLLEGHFADALAVLLGRPSADTGWLHLVAYLQYRTGQMRSAGETAERLVSLDPDAAALHLLGRIRLWLQRPDAEEAFAGAADLDPEHYVRPYRVDPDQFERMAAAALRRIPPEFHQFLDNTLIVVEPLPRLRAVRAGEDPDLLGLYEGATALERGLPERIVLYQVNHENVSGSKEELAEMIEETVRHEVGHHFGMEEDELPY